MPFRKNRKPLPPRLRSEALERRLLLSITQTDPAHMIFEASTPDATITAGVDGTTWLAVGGAGVAGHTSWPSGGAALEAVNQSADLAVRSTGSVTYPIRFTTPGVYRLYVRGKYTGGGDNSMWVPPHKADGTSPINGDPANATDNGNPFDNHNGDAARAGDYHWFGSDASDVPVMYTVGAGETTLTFKVREAGFVIDKVVLSTNASLAEAQLDALATVPPDSPRGGATAHYYNNNFWGYLSGWDGEYGRPDAPSFDRPFPDQSLTVYGAGDVVTTVPVIAFDWSNTPPDPAIRPFDFSTAFVGRITAPESGAYTFLGFGDDTHVFVDGRLVSSAPGLHWLVDPRGELSVSNGGGAAPITLSAGESYAVVVLQSAGPGGNALQLKWITPSMTAAAMGSAAALPPAVVPSQFLSPAEAAPHAPAGVTRVGAPPGEVAFEFADVADDELHYEVQRSFDGGTTWSAASIAQPINSHRAIGVAPLPGETALYRVVAWNFAGTGESSPPISVTSPPAAGGAGASAYYFNDQFWKGYPSGLIVAPARALAGNDVIVGRDAGAYAVEPRVDFNWGLGSPAPGLVRDEKHSSVFQGKLGFPEPGVYTLAAFSDDDSYLWVGNQLASAAPGGHIVPRGVEEGTYDFNGIALKNPVTIDAAGREYDFTAVQSDMALGSEIHLAWVTPSMAAAGQTAAVAVPTRCTRATSPTCPRRRRV